jgi:site-specific DNA recombinase
VPARTPIRCAIYTRQSVEAYTDLSSCQVQFDLCQAYVQSQRSLGYVIIEERFDDEGYSGTTLDRPALHRLLTVVRSGGIEQLVIHRLDRLSRNLRHIVTLFEELRDHNVTLEIVTAQGLGEAALDKFMLSILASFAEFERDLAASRIAEARAHLKAHGRRIAGAVPYGYEADHHTKQLIVCDEEAQAVVRMFRWAESGVTPSVIAGYAKALRWITGGGNPWTARQVLAILGNHVYAGLVMHGSRLREGRHAALIDREVYDRVQNIIAGRRTHVPGKRVSGAGILWILRCRHFVDSPGPTPLRRLRPIDEHAYGAIRTGHSWLLSMPIHGARLRGMQGSHDSAYEIETAVLSEIGVGPKLTSKEQQAALRAAVRAAVYDAPSGKVKIELVVPPRGIVASQ